MEQSIQYEVLSVMFFILVSEMKTEHLGFVLDNEISVFGSQTKKRVIHTDCSKISL